MHRTDFRILMKHIKQAAASLPYNIDRGSLCGRGIIIKAWGKLKNWKLFDIIPSLTHVKVKSGYNPSSYAGCSRFLFGNDLCYFFTSSVLVLFIMLRMADFEINS